MIRRFLTTVTLTLTVVAVGTGASAQSESLEEQARAAEAAEVLRELRAVDETGIPANLLERPKAIAVLPDVVRGAFVVVSPGKVRVTPGRRR